MNKFTEIYQILVWLLTLTAFRVIVVALSRPVSTNNATPELEHGSINSCVVLRTLNFVGCVALETGR